MTQLDAVSEASALLGVRGRVSLRRPETEIDATALLALETMTDVVAAVKSDRTMTPQ